VSGAVKDATGASKDLTGIAKDVSAIRKDVVETKIAEKKLEESERLIRPATDGDSPAPLKVLEPVKDLYSSPASASALRMYPSPRRV
jgi:hypothetical protein